MSLSFDIEKTLVQYISFFTAFIFNIVLIFLIINKSPSKLGSYKNLMIFFCIFAVFFTLLDFVIQPIIQTHGCCFFMIIDSRNGVMSPEIANVVASVLCGCLGMLLYIIAIHFIFRYCALERKGKLMYFQGTYLRIWFLIPLVVGFYWSANCYYFMAPSAKTTQYIREVVKEQYQLNIDEITYLAAYFYPPDEQGIPHLDKKLTFGMCTLLVIGGIPLFVFAFFGTKCYYSVRSLIDNGDSSYTKSLQKQLYKALIAQTIIPLVLILIPFTVYFTCPVLEIEIGHLSKLVTFTYAIYPAVDPLPIILIIDNYRYAMLGLFNQFFGCRIGKHNRTGCDTELTSMRERPTVDPAASTHY